MIHIHSKDLKLEPLSIPAGFEVYYNQFYTILDEGQEIYFEDDDIGQNPCELYRNTLLQLLYKPLHLLIDLEWAPESDPEGSFYITLIRTDDKHWEHPLVEFSSRHKNEIVDKLNELMSAVSKGDIR